MVRGRSKGALRVLAGLVAGLVVAGGAAAAGLPLPRTKAPAFGATNAVAGGKANGAGMQYSKRGGAGERANSLSVFGLLWTLLDASCSPTTHGA